MTRKRDEESERNSSAEGPLPEICTALVLQCPVSTWIADRDGTNVFVNEAARRLFGIERDEEVVGKYNVFKDEVLIAGGFMPQIKKVFEEGGSTEITVDYDFSQVTHVEPSQPTHKIHHVILFAIKDRDGRVRNVVVQHEDWTERISTEKALKKSEERYREMTEGISDWIWEIDAKGRCTYSSPAIEEILGYTPEEVIGKPILDFILPEYRQYMAGQIEQALKERRGMVGSLTGAIHKDGSIRYIETNANPVFDESGDLAGFRGMNRDVTDRVEAERALEKERKRFRALIENASDVITVMNADGIMIYVSPAVERVLGYRPEELIGLSAFDFVHPDDLARGRQGFSLMLEHEGVMISSEFRLRHHDGSWRTFEAISQNLLGVPAVRGIVFNHRDITERTRAEEALGESEKRFRALVENSFDITMLVDAEGNIMYISPSVKPILGYSPEEMVGTSIFDLGPPDEVPRIRPIFRALAEHVGMSESGREFRLRHQDGSWHTMETAAKNMLDDPVVNGIIINHRDVTERKQAQEELERYREHLEEAVHERTAELESANRRLRNEVARRKRAQEATGEAEARLRHLVSSSPAVIYTSKAYGDYAATFISRNIEEQLGYQPREFTDDPGFWAAHIHPDDVGRVLEEVPAVLAMGHYVYEYRFRHKDGSYRWMRDEVRLIRDADGNPVELIGSWIDITPRREAEEELQRYKEHLEELVEERTAELTQAYERLHTIVDTSPLAIVTLDLETRVTAWNPAAEKMFGWTAGEVIGKPLPVLPEDYLTRFGEDLQRLLAGEVTNGIEMPHIRKDGSRIEVRVSVAALHDPEGATTGFLGILADITERKQAEEALRESEERYKQLVEMMNEGLAVADGDYRFTYVNNRFCEMLEYTPQEMIGRPITEFVHEDSHKVIRDQMARRKAGKVDRYELAWKSKDGRTVYTLVSPRPVFDEAGSFAGSVAVLTDVTEWRRAEDALKEREEWFRSVVQHVSDVVFVVDADMAIKYASPASLRVLGYEPGDLAGKNAWELVHPDDLGVVDEAFGEVLRMENTFVPTDFRARHADGRWVQLEAVGNNMLDHPAIQGVIITARDVTDRRMAEEVIKQKQREVTTLLDGLPGYAFFKDANGVYIIANEMFARALGRTPEDIVGKTDFDIFPRDLAEKYRADDSVLLQTGEALEVGEECMIEGDRQVTVATRKVPLKDENGQVIGLIGLGFDVTERKKAEEALMESEEKYRSLVETTDTGYLIVDTQGRVIDANAEYVRLTGRKSLDEILGHSVLEWTATYDLERNEQEVRKCAESGLVRNLDIDYVSPDGRVTPIEISATVIESAEGPRILTLCRDITERRLAEETQREGEKHKREFYRRTILAATEGKLVVTDPDEIKRIAGRPIAQWEIKSGEELSSVRRAIADEARAQGMDEDRLCDFVLATGEATTNAFKHAGGGKASLSRVDDSLIAVVSDRGGGMEALSLPEVALVRGYSTVGSLGMGYKAMLAIADKVYLATGPTGTTVAIQMSLHKAETPAMAGALPDTWKT